MEASLRDAIICFQENHLSIYGKCRDYTKVNIIVCITNKLQRLDVNDVQRYCVLHVINYVSYK